MFLALAGFIVAGVHHSELAALVGFRVLAVILLIVAMVLQTGATSATKAIKFSAKLVTGHGAEAAESPVPDLPAGRPTDPPPVIFPTVAEEI